MVTSLNTQQWIETFALNHWVIEKQLDGISHDDSMIMPPFRANCLNWVTGHIVEHRDWMLRALDQTTLMPAREVDLYRRGSDTMQAEDEVVLFQQLCHYLQQSKSAVISGLQAVSTDFLQEIPTTGILMASHKDKTRFDRLQGLLWHETYHVGQLELLRQLTGKNDAILS
ncbi:MAG: DinB family protein [Phototrophicaceae bacterium]